MQATCGERRKRICFSLCLRLFLTSRIPEKYRNPEGLWFGFATRNRIVFYNPARVRVPPTSWQDLADSRFKDKICVRSSSNIYNLSLLASFVELWGEAKATEWAQAIRDNMARDPSGGDTDQIRAVAAGGVRFVYRQSLLLRAFVGGLTSLKIKAVTEVVKPVVAWRKRYGSACQHFGSGCITFGKKQAGGNSLLGVFSYGRLAIGV